MNYFFKIVSALRSQQRANQSTATIRRTVFYLGKLLSVNPLQWSLVNGVEMGFDSRVKSACGFLSTGELRLLTVAMSD